MRSTLTALRGGPLQTAPQLTDMVQAHLAKAREHADNDPFLDLGAAEAVARTLNALLKDWDAMDDPTRRHVQSACRYFASQDDAEPDFTSVVGFDDDVEAVNLVLDRIGRNDLRIAL